MRIPRTGGITQLNKCVFLYTVSYCPLVVAICQSLAMMVRVLIVFWCRYGFRTPPHLELKARPKLGEREVTLAHVTDWIEKKLKQEFEVS